MRTPHSVSDPPPSTPSCPACVPDIHVLARGTKARGWPGRRREASSPRPAMTEHGSEPTRVDSDRVTTPSTPSCPALCRVSTSLLAAPKHVDGRDKPGHDEPRPGRRREAKLRRLAGHDDVC